MTCCEGREWSGAESVVGGQNMDKRMVGSAYVCEISNVLGVKGVVYVHWVATEEIDWCSGVGNIILTLYGLFYIHGHFLLFS